MALIIAKNVETDEEATIDDAWLTRWPGEFTLVRYVGEAPDESPAQAAGGRSDEGPASQSEPVNLTHFQ